jgi:translin
MNLKTVLNKIQKELERKEKVREELKKDMRKATRLSKQAILLVHQERFKDAQELLHNASKIFVKLSEVSKNYPDLMCAGFVSPAFEENTEAHTFLQLVRGSRFVDPYSLEIPRTSYLLGLADVIGEFRRRVLDMIRKGDAKEAAKCLQTMEHIYTELTNMDNAYLFVRELRRKCDIARRLIEITRGDVTMETRRNKLANQMEKLERQFRRDS